MDQDVHFLIMNAVNHVFLDLKMHLIELFSDLNKKQTYVSMPVFYVPVGP